MNLRAAFHSQSKACGALGSPFMARLLMILAENWPEGTPLDRHFATFSGDIGPSGASLPLRLAGGLHALVRRGANAGLNDVYPPRVCDDASLGNAVISALKTHSDFLIDWTQSAPQTNEVRRSAVLIAGAHVAHQLSPLPIVLSELGASGGLNLMWDHYGLDINGEYFGPNNAALTLRPVWEGPFPPTKAPKIAQRAGVDLNPLNPKNRADLERLLAYLWADQPDRITLTERAAAVCSAHVSEGDAIDWLEHRLAAAPMGHLHLIQNTVAWQYFPYDAQKRGTALIESAGAKATADRPLAWLSMEADDAVPDPGGAAIILRMWPANVTVNLGRADFHGRWIKWRGLQ